MPSTVRTYCVAPQKVSDIWPHVEGKISAAVEQCGDWTLDGIKSLLFSGNALLWITAEDLQVRAATVTRLYRSSSGLICHVVACSGDGVDWSEQLGIIEDFAKAEGCSLVRVEGRRGWERVLNKYRVKYVILERAL